MSGGVWSPERAAGFLLERGMFGIEPGTAGIEELLARLGDPQLSFRKLHVVGTNGKSSTARYAAHLLARRGIRAGAFLSPHLAGFEQRVLVPATVGPVECDPGRFADAAGSVIEAAVELEGEWDDRRVLTQFELVTATAFLLLSRHGVDAAAIEAGMGGRLDSTNVLGEGVVCLTSVSLDHTEWLGADVGSIAREKLAVVRPGDALVVSPRLPAGVEAAIDEAVERSGRPLTVASDEAADRIGFAALGDFQRCNLAIAAAAVRTLLDSDDPVAVRDVAAEVVIPGRLQRISERPEVLVDCAHNPEAAARLIDEVGSIAAGRPVVAVIGVLADKDASGMLDAILGGVKSLFVTTPDSPRALPASELARIAGEIGDRRVEVIERPREALAAAVREAGEDGLVICAGSIALIGELVHEAHERTVTAL